ncbi:hypothetical protein QEN19_001926 [Hanseniaspora menglaensis]
MANTDFKLQQALSSNELFELSNTLSNTTLDSDNYSKRLSSFNKHQTLDIYNDQKYHIKNVNVLDFIKSDSKLTEAVNIFEKATEREKVGKMNDAVRYYKESMKLHEDVEAVYRKKLFYEYAVEMHHKNLVSSNVDAKMTSTLKSKNGDDDPDKEKDPCLLIDMLPLTVLNRIAVFLLEMNQETLVNFVSACSFLNKNCLHGNTMLYKVLAEKIYEHQFYDIGISFKLHKQEKEVIDSWNIHDYYKGDYKLMLQKRPYIKFQGVYISVNNYIRHGGIVEGSSSLFNPIHMVTYYRYYRFLPNGDCIRLVTTDEPDKVVKNIKYGTKDSTIAKWSINTTDCNLLTLERFDKSGDKCVEQLRIENHSKRLPHNKLVWENSFYLDDSGEKVTFRLKNEKNFYFSRVRSYTVEVNNLM